MLAKLLALIAAAVVFALFVALLFTRFVEGQPLVAWAILLATLAVVVALVHTPPVRWRLLLVLPLAAIGATALAGCAALGGSETTKAVLAHIELCDRHYTGAFGPTGANGSVDIACKAQTPAPAATPPSP